MREFLELFFKMLIKDQKKDKTLKSSPVVSLYVDKKIDHKRYDIFIRDKKIVCISHKELKLSKHYWGVIQKDSFGIITLKDLYIQPKPFQISTPISFEMNLKEMVDIIKSLEYKKLYANLLKKQTNIQYNLYLYCLEKDILTFPLYIFDEIMFLQFQQNRKEFYFALKNYGAFKGVVKKNRVLLWYLYNSLDLFRSTDIIVSKDTCIEPLCDISTKLIDIKC